MFSSKKFEKIKVEIFGFNVLNNNGQNNTHNYILVLKNIKILKTYT